MYKENSMNDTVAKTIKTSICGLLYLILLIVSWKYIGWKTTTIIYCVVALHNINKHWPFEED